ncbi:Developmentally-regulated G-protein 3 [Bonamia ostreae]|uniref:Developmentally-regulated G-protein 3 n=1 Tax=Bonamia ostreae TaxID=126728 RepID=A0ABV2AHD1_9EUKA
MFRSLPDFEEPVILRSKYRTVKDFCLTIHKDLMSDFKRFQFKFDSALVWGTSAKYYPQTVGKNHRLLDEDVIQIVKGLPSAK